MIKEFENRSKEELISIIKNNTTENFSKIIIARYGIEDGKPRTLCELHEMFPQYTREKIRQIEEKFLNDLRVNGFNNEN